VLASGTASVDYKLSLRDAFDSKTGTFTEDFQAEVCGFAHALRKLKVDWSLIAKPYETGAKRLLLKASLGSLTAYKKLLEQIGIAGTLSSYPPNHDAKQLMQLAARGTATCQTAYSSYRTWCQRHGRRDERPEAEFQLVMLSIQGVTVKTLHRGGEYIDVYRGLPQRRGNDRKGQVVSLPG